MATDGKIPPGPGAGTDPTSDPPHPTVLPQDAFAATTIVATLAPLPITVDADEEGLAFATLSLEANTPYEVRCAVGSPAYNVSDIGNIWLESGGVTDQVSGLPITDVLNNGIVQGKPQIVVFGEPTTLTAFASALTFAGGDIEVFVLTATKLG